MIETLLKKKIGLNPDSIGKKKIEADVRRCMTEQGMTDVKEYTELLQTSAAELERLIEAITVPETWFFRYRSAFDYFESYVRAEWMPGNRGNILRILSVPCSTGEESYSIAITLLNSGVSAEHFHIDAVDISKKGVLNAKHAVYGKNSFRGKDLTFRNQYFIHTEEDHTLLPEIRQTLNFTCDNILNPFFLIHRDPYDVIFCRNLLIYFNRDAQQRTVSVLNRLLKVGGLLFVGHAETGSFSDTVFSPVRHPGVFAFRKASAYLKRSVQADNEAAGTSAILKTKDKIFSKNPLNAVQVSIPSSSSLSNHRPASMPEKKTESIIGTARSLADQGKLIEAAELCEARLKENNTDTEAYCLLGLIQLGLKDNLSAEKYFNKAVYLNPKHREALIYLALINEQRGDKKGALLFQQRADRAGKHQRLKGIDE